MQEPEQGADRGDLQEVRPDRQRQAQLPRVQGHDEQAVRVEGEGGQAAAAAAAGERAVRQQCEAAHWQQREAVGQQWRAVGQQQCEARCKQQ